MNTNTPQLNYNFFPDTLQEDISKLAIAYSYNIIIVKLIKCILTFLNLINIYTNMDVTINLERSCPSLAC